MAFAMEVALVKSKKNAIVDKKRCVACGECIISCRKNAVSINAGCFAVVDANICVGCGLCSKSCPVGCITLIEQEEV